MNKQIRENAGQLNGLKLAHYINCAASNLHKNSLL